MENNIDLQLKYETVREDMIIHEVEMPKEIKEIGAGAYLEIIVRVKALKDFADVKAGDLGGFLAGNAELSQLGDCWIYNDAKALGGSKIEGNAQLRDTAEIGAGGST